MDVFSVFLTTVNHGYTCFIVNKVLCREYEFFDRDDRALVVQARKKKNACYFLGVGSKQGRLDLDLPKIFKYVICVLLTDT